MEEKKEARQKRNREKLATADWVMAEFYATWCPHCKRMQPVVEEFKKLMEGTLEVVQIDIDQEDALANFYTIESDIYFNEKGRTALEAIWRTGFRKAEESSERL